MARKIRWTALICCTLACAAERESAETPGQGDASAGPSVSARAPADSTPVVLFLGTSLTAGLGLSLDEAYPALIQERIDSAGLGFRVVNAGVSGETSAGALRRIDWLLGQPLAVLVLESGANDALRGQDLAAARRNLQQIITRTRERHPRASVVVAGMQAPPNLGERYTRGFRDLFVELANANEAALIPFLLADVAAVPELNLGDGIHPNAEGHRVLADNVWAVLEPILRERRNGDRVAE